MSEGRDALVNHRGLYAKVTLIRGLQLQAKITRPIFTMPVGSLITVESDRIHYPVKKFVSLWGACTLTSEDQRSKQVTDKQLQTIVESIRHCCLALAVIISTDSCRSKSCTSKTIKTPAPPHLILECGLTGETRCLFRRCLHLARTTNIKFGGEGGALPKWCRILRFNRLEN